MYSVVCWVLIAGVLPVVISLILESLRKQPPTPESLYWNADIAIQYTIVDGVRLRYIKAGKGPDLVLLHTLRTQLDIFQKVVPELLKDYTVYALDYPGHGFSDIPQAAYTPDFFVKAVEGFLEKLDINNATLAGISIGGTIPLLIAAKHNPRVKKVIAINPYDYGKGLGVARGNFIAWLIVNLSRIPVLGDTVMRFRNTMVEKIIMRGGVTRADALPKEYLQQVWNSGVRKGHYRGFLSLIRNAAKWEQGHQVYPQINIPVVLVYGDHDWSNVAERQQTLKGILGAQFETVKDGGHFLSLDQPEAVIRLIKQYAA